MLKRLSTVLVALLLLASGAVAQSSSDETANTEAESTEASAEACRGDLYKPLAPEADDPQSPDSTSTAAGISGSRRASEAPPGAGEKVLSPTEQKVKEIISQEGVHVVRFWAPWCSNSIGEMDNGWNQLITDNEDVTFTFVTVWNEGEPGARTLDEYDIPERVMELTPQSPEEGRLGTFLDHNIYWIPSTWIFHNKGERAFAMNYGEMDMSTIQTLIDATQAEW